MLISHPKNREEAFLGEVGEPVRRFLRRVLHEREMVEDAEQETILTLIQRFRAGVKLRRPISFALQVAWSKALDVQRRALRRPTMPAAVAQRPSDPARMAELKDWLESGLAALRPAERAVLHLRYVEDLSYRELARVLDEPIGTIGRRLHDARLALKTSLERSSGDPVPESTIGVLLPLLRTLDCLRPVPPPPVAAELAAKVAPRFVALHQTMLGACAFILLGAGIWLALLAKGHLQSARTESGAAALEGAPPRLAALDAGPDAPARERRPNPALAILGRVVDASGNPVPDAVVFRMRGSGGGVQWDPAFTSRADATRTAAGGDGTFAIETAPDEHVVDLVATATGFASAILPHVRAGVSGVVMQLSPGLTIGGVIMDLESTPIANAAVTYHARVGESGVRATTRSARDGRWRFERLPIDPALTRPDAGTVEVDADGYAHALRPVGIAAPGTEPGVLEMDVWMPRGSVLEGVVRDEESEAPVAGATVEVWVDPSFEAPARPGYPALERDPVAPHRIARTVADELGRYRIEHLPVRIAGIEPGCRWAPHIDMEKPVLAGGLVVSAPGRAPAVALIPLATADDAVVELDVALRPEIVLEGDVRDGRGAPLPGVQITAAITGRDLLALATSPERLQGGRIPASAVTDADGHWSLGALPPVTAPHRLEIAASSGGRRTTLALAGVSESSRLPSIVLADAPQRLPRGLVVDDRGAPIAGAIVRAMRVPEPRLAAPPDVAVTDREGRFDLPPADANADVELRIEAFGFATTCAALNRGEDRELRFAMPRERAIRGAVRSADGRPVAGALVSAILATASSDEIAPEHIERNSALAIATTAADASGAFTLRGVPPERVRLWVGVPWPRNDGLLGLLLGRRFSVLVPEPTADQPLLVTLPGYRADRGRARVHVVDAASKAPVLHELAGSLVGADGQVGGHGIFAGPGLLLFEAVPVGTYTLRGQAAGYAPFTIAEVKIAGSEPREARIEAVRGARLFGRVKPDGEHPFHALYVCADSAAKDVAPLFVRCDDDGSFDIDGIAAGTWTVSGQLQEFGHAPDMRSRPVTLTLEAGKDAPRLDLELLPIQRVTVRLSGALAQGDTLSHGPDSPQYSATLFKLAEFRVRCRDQDGLLWFDLTLTQLGWKVTDRDVVVRLPLPEGVYALEIERKGTKIGALKIASPGSAEIVVPDP